MTHDGEKLPCWPLEALSSFKEKIGLEAYRKVTSVWTYSLTLKRYDWHMLILVPQDIPKHT